MNNAQDDEFGFVQETVPVDTAGAPAAADAIHITNSDADDQDSKETDSDRRPVKNLVTGVPESELEFERSSSGSRKTAPKLLIAATVASVVIIFAVAMFFILKGKNDYKETANVKDNSLKTGVNSNGSEMTDFGNDYAKRYGDNSNTSASPETNTNANANPPPVYGTVGNNMTAAPSPPLGNNTGGIYQPAQINPPPVVPPQNSGPGGGSSNGGSPSGSNPKTEVVPRINPDRTTEVVELPANRFQSTSGSGGTSRNDQVSLFFYEPPTTATGGGRVQPIEQENNVVPRPAFGTLLPVKILGRLHTLGTGGLARLELTRTVRGSWGELPRGTLLVGRVSGSESNRLFVSLLGYIDSRSNRLVTIGGDLQGKDGALGAEGEIKRIGSRWRKVFGELFGAAKEIGTAYLLGRTGGGGGTVINNGQLTKIPNSLDDKTAAKFVLVPAGAEGYIVINDLPPAVESDERLAGTTNDLTDEEILKMIRTDAPSEVERIIPGLSPRGRQIARGTLK